MKRLTLLALATAALAAVGCGNKDAEAPVADVPGEATTNKAPGAGKAKAETGFGATEAGQNADSRLGSKGG